MSDDFLDHLEELGKPRSQHQWFDRLSEEARDTLLVARTRWREGAYGGLSVRAFYDAARARLHITCGRCKFVEWLREANGKAPDG